MGFKNRYILFDEISSTNDYMKENYETLPNHTIVYAHLQTAGRGRLGRKWEGKKGENIAMSMLIKEDLPKTYSSITLLAATSVYKILHKMGLDIQIKWPNDLLIQGKKIVGILTEGVSTEEKIQALIIGIGINVNQTLFSKEIKAQTTSIRLELGYQVIADELMITIGEQLAKDMEDYKKGNTSYLSLLEENLYKKNEEIEYTRLGKTFQGTIKGLAEDGCLIVETDHKKYRILSGEIKIKR